MFLWSFVHEKVTFSYYAIVLLQILVTLVSANFSTVSDFFMLHKQLVCDYFLDSGFFPKDSVCIILIPNDFNNLLFSYRRLLFFFPPETQLNSQQDMSEAGVSAVSENATPERVFKVVFVGDSGVGKSSFIHRFCHDAWRPSFTATIGNELMTQFAVWYCQSQVK